MSAVPLDVTADDTLLHRARVAIKSLAVLKDDNENPHYARLLHLSMDRGTYSALGQQMRSDATGRQLLDERPTLPTPGVTVETLALLPEGTLGHAWAHYYRDNQISPFHFDFEVSDDADYLTKRYRETHDIHHVITGYAIDPLGEVELQAFYLGNMGLKNAAFIVWTWMFAQFSELPLRDIPDGIKRLRAAYQLGQRTPMLLGIPFEQMWERPVTEIRAELGL